MHPTPDRAEAPLTAQATATAEADHKRRLAEIKELAPLLQRLDAIHPALLSKGLRIWPGSVRLERDYIGTTRRKVLRLDINGLFGNHAKLNLWRATLIEQGFVEDSRSSGACATVLLKKGTLLLRIDLPRDPVEQAAGARRYADACSAAAAAATGQEVAA